MEQRFLYQVAQKYFEHHEWHLNSVTFVVPNKRSAFFLREHVGELMKKDPSLGNPVVMTMTELMEKTAGQKRASSLRLLVMLYSAYLNVLQKRPGRSKPLPEEFDRFRFWGEMILRDFDETDRYMADPGQLFRNVKDFKEIQSTYLTEEHREIIRTYWGEDPYYGADSSPDLFWTHIHQEGEDSPARKFVLLWEILHELYTEFNRLLTEHGETYTGRAYRRAASLVKENANLRSLPALKYVFVGFNRLSIAEHLVMEKLHERGRADFYWDYSPELMDPDTGNKSGRFISEYIKRFPSHYTLDDFRPKKHIVEIVGIPSNIGQVKFASTILSAQSALVLPSEDLLPPVLASLPATIPSVNVTMGYPLKNSSLASFFSCAVKLQLRMIVRSTGHTEFFRDDVQTVISHPIISDRYPEECQAIVDYMAAEHVFNLPDTAFDSPECRFAALRPVFTPVKDSDGMDAVASYTLRLLDLLTESGLLPIEKMFAETIRTEVEELNRQATAFNVRMRRHTFFRLLENALFKKSINLEGNGATGLQVMGVLETRALSFREVVMMSMTDRVFPGRLTSRSFIPDTLRRAFGLPTAEHQESSMAYYFYRLLSHTEKMWLLFDARTGGLRSGEMSRYLYQLRFLNFSGIEIRYRQATYNVRPSAVTEVLPADISLGIRKTPEIMADVERLRDRSRLDTNALSASSLKLYINCPLAFYLEHVAEIKVPDPFKNYIDDATYGTIIHEVAQRVYEQIRDRHTYMITQKDLDSLTGNTIVDDQIRRAINLHYRKFPAKILSDNNGLQQEIPNPALYEYPLEGEAKFIAKAMRHIFFEMVRHEHVPFTFIRGEARSKFQWSILPDVTVNFTMSIDRIDKISDGTNGEIVRLIDYKSGSDATEFPSLESLFDFSGTKNTKGIFQLMTYCCAYADEHRLPEETPLRPLIYPLRTVATEGIPPLLYNKKEFNNFREIESGFRARLAEKVAEIFNPSVPFYRSADDHGCKFCKYKRLCGVKPADEE